MREIEDQIRLWVDGAVDGVEAVSADEARSGAASSDDRVMQPPRRWLAASIAAAMVVAVAAAAVAVSTRSDPRRPTHVKTLDPAAQSTVLPTSPEPLWRELREPTFGWTLEIPATWRAQSFRGRCKVDASGTIITNFPGPISPVKISNGCTTALALPDSPPDDLIVLEVSHFVGPGDHPTVQPDTPLPLRIFSQPERSEGQLVHRSLGVVAGGDRGFRLDLWTGSGVSEADERMISRTVESIVTSEQPPFEPLTFVGLSTGSEQVQLASDGESTGPLGQAVFSVLYDLGPGERGARDSSIRATLSRWDGARASFDELERTGEFDELAAAAPVRSTVVRGGIKALRREMTWNGDQITSVQWLERDDVKVEVVGYNVEDDVFDELVDRLIVAA